MVRADSRADQATGWIGIPPDATGDMVTITHQVVHLQQLALYRPAGPRAGRGQRHLGAAPPVRERARGAARPGAVLPGRSDRLRRRATAAPAGLQRLALLRAAGRAPRPAGRARDLYDRSRALGARDHRAHFLEALEAVLAERDTTLPATFAEFTSANLVGGYGLQGLARRRYGGHRAVRRPGHRHAHAALPAARGDARPPVGGVLPAASGSDAAACGRAAAAGRRCACGSTGPPTWRRRSTGRRSGRAAAGRAGRAGGDGRAVFKLAWSTCSGREVGVGRAQPERDDRRPQVHGDGRAEGRVG